MDSTLPIRTMQWWLSLKHAAELDYKLQNDKVDKKCVFMVTIGLTLEDVEGVAV
jgi:hypothetical protein